MELYETQTWNYNESRIPPLPTVLLGLLCKQEREHSSEAIKRNPLGRDDKSPSETQKKRFVVVCRSVGRLADSKGKVKKREKEGSKQKRNGEAVGTERWPEMNSGDSPNKKRQKGDLFECESEMSEIDWEGWSQWVHSVNSQVGGNKGRLATREWRKEKDKMTDAGDDEDESRDKTRNFIDRGKEEGEYSP